MASHLYVFVSSYLAMHHSSLLPGSLVQISFMRCCLLIQASSPISILLHPPASLSSLLLFFSVKPAGQVGERQRPYARVPSDQHGVSGCVDSTGSLLVGRTAGIVLDGSNTLNHGLISVRPCIWKHAAKSLDVMWLEISCFML
jgi:hypothetical protein